MCKKCCPVKYCCHTFLPTSRYSLTLCVKSTNGCRPSRTRGAGAGAARRHAAPVADCVKWFVSKFLVFRFFKCFTSSFTDSIFLSLVIVFNPKNTLSQYWVAFNISVYIYIYIHTIYIYTYMLFRLSTVQGSASSGTIGFIIQPFQQIDWISRIESSFLGLFVGYCWYMWLIFLF